MEISFSTYSIFLSSSWWCLTSLSSPPSSSSSPSLIIQQNLQDHQESNLFCNFYLSDFWFIGWSAPCLRKFVGLNSIQFILFVSLLMGYSHKTWSKVFVSKIFRTLIFWRSYKIFVGPYTKYLLWQCGLVHVYTNWYRGWIYCTAVKLFQAQCVHHEYWRKRRSTLNWLRTKKCQKRRCL